MANTKQSAKRAKQENKRNVRNTKVRSKTKTAVKTAIDAVKSLDVAQVKDAYAKAIKTLSKAASKGVIPKGRAARKISRLTLLLKKSKPEALSTKAAKASKK
jgi:small subunit ribosomal protein S20